MRLPIAGCVHLAVTTAASATASLNAGTVFTAAVMWGIADMTASVTRFVGMEMVEGSFAAVWKGSGVTTARIETVVDMAVKAAGAVKPGTGAEEEAAHEPVRPVVAVGGTVIRLEIEVAIGANRRTSDAD